MTDVTEPKMVAFRDNQTRAEDDTARVASSWGVIDAVAIV